MDSLIIRKAKAADAAHIIVAHVRSIRELCSKDYSSLQIRAWAGREFSTESWIKRMLESWVWVAEKDSFVEGVSFLRKLSDEVAYIDALYLTPQVSGLGVGAKMLALMVNEARTQGFKRVELDATLTSHAFYMRQGFIEDSDGAEQVFMGGVEIPCIHMKMEF